MIKKIYKRRSGGVIVADYSPTEEQPLVEAGGTVLEWWDGSFHSPVHIRVVVFRGSLARELGLVPTESHHFDEVVGFNGHIERIGPKNFRPTRSTYMQSLEREARLVGMSRRNPNRY